LNRAKALLDWAYSQPDKPCLVTETESLSYAETRDAIEATAAKLQGLVGVGTHVGLFIDSTPDFVIHQYAVYYLGGVITPLNRALKDTEVDETVQYLGISAVISDAPLHLTAEIPVIVIGEGSPLFSDWSVPPLAELGPDDGAMILQTSGSTGRPKGVLLTLGNLAANYDPTHRWIGVGKDDRILLMLPIFNTYALNQGINLMAMSGASMFLLRRFTPEGATAAIERFQPTVIPMVPTMVTRLAQSGLRYDEPCKVGIGAASSPTQITSDAWTAFPQAHLYFGYGLTEATAIVSLNHVGTKDTTHGDFFSCGPIVPGIQVKLDGVTGDDQPGEILVKGDLVFTAYIGTDEPRPVVDGWLHTGDIGVFHDGKISIVDRKRELIIRGGQNIYPGEVERVLSAHPAVLEASVVPGPDPDLGEVPVAFVVLRSGFEATEDELLDWQRERLAAFKVPTRVFAIETMPKTPTGKIRKLDLIPMAAELSASA